MQAKHLKPAKFKLYDETEHVQTDRQIDRYTEAWKLTELPSRYLWSVVKSPFNITLSSGIMHLNLVIEMIKCSPTIVSEAELFCCIKSYYNVEKSCIKLSFERLLNKNMVDFNIFFTSGKLCFSRYFFEQRIFNLWPAKVFLDVILYFWVSYYLQKIFSQ